MIGYLFTGIFGCRLGIDAKRGEDAMGDAFAISWATAHCSLSGRSAVPTTMVPCPTVPPRGSASSTRRPREASAPLWATTRPIRSARTVASTRRPGDTGLPEHVGGTGIERGSDLIGGDFGEHGTCHDIPGNSQCIFMYTIPWPCRFQGHLGEFPITAFRSNQTVVEQKAVPGC